MTAPTESDRSFASAIEAALNIVRAAAAADSVSLWTLTGDGISLVCAAGELGPSTDDLRRAAGGVLEQRPSEDAHLSAIRIQAQPGAAALLAMDTGATAGTHDHLLRAACPALASLLGNPVGVSPGSGTDASVAALQRRLARLRYDLHDGPLQDVHLIAQDLRLFRDQLAPMLGEHPDRERALGRLDDLEAQLVALDDDLRRIITSVRSPLLGPGSLPQALAHVTETFISRTAIVPLTEVHGDIEGLTDSQQIAILSLIREALTNVRRHSDAENVTIDIVARADRVDVAVRDDGRGFCPEVARGHAAQAGRLGLIGMQERIRMLGGHAEVTSRPCGPTVISATVPRWPQAER